ncbi:sensor domain-containing diguanylate cyclase [Rhodococcus aerolatus]
MTRAGELVGALEADRVAALRAVGVLDAPPSDDLDAVVALAQAAVGLAGAAVNFLDDRRQYQAATSAALPLHCARTDSMCSVAVDTAAPVHAPDTRTDPRFRDSPFVTGELGRITRYAASPVRSGGMVVGTVCVFDTDGPGELTAAQRHTLDLLAAQTGRLLELRRVNRSLRDIALQDELTGLPNRRALPAVADDAVGSGARTLAYVDLDGFKRVNDVGGHHVGDRVLQVVAHRLRRAVRQPDVVVRMGGDEFLVVCGAAVDEAELAARLARVVAAPVVVEGRSWTLGLSAGYTTAPAGEPLELGVQRADAAMYRAKTSRRSA